MYFTIYGSIYPASIILVCLKIPPVLLSANFFDDEAQEEVLSRDNNIRSQPLTIKV